MFSTLQELLKEKGIITEAEFEDKMRARIERTKGKKSFRDIQLANRIRKLTNLIREGAKLCYSQ